MTPRPTAARPPVTRRQVLAGLAAAPLAAAGPARAAGYDPLALPAAALPAPLDLGFDDAARRRDVPLRAYLPAGGAPAPVLLFSHGLGGSRSGGSGYLGAHWAARGYVLVALQHHGSDELVWQGKPLLQGFAALKRAAGADNLKLRAEDVRATLDQLARWQATPGHALAGRLDLARVGMSGHSFGAHTTQAVSGQGFPPPWGRGLTDTRIGAALCLSPSAPQAGDAGAAFGGVRIPWLLMTGTRDIARIGPATLASRLAVYPALPPGGKYELVLDGAEHSAFGDRDLPGEHAARNPNHHRAILALSTAFWDAHLRGDAAARDWLDGAGPRGVLQAADRWQHK
ncbi:MAG: hypothetical protein U1F53_23600 [Burkholderiaceae bacterium]